MRCLAGHMLGLSQAAVLCKELHKVGLVNLQNTVHWWKACPSDRHNTVLVQKTHPTPRRLAHAYLGGCPICPDSFEIVVIATDPRVAALLAVLPKMLVAHVPNPAGHADVAELSEPKIHCDLWNDDLQEQELMIQQLSEWVEFWQSNETPQRFVMQ